MAEPRGRRNGRVFAPFAPPPPHFSNLRMPFIPKCIRTEGEGPEQLRKLFVGGLNRDSTDDKVDTKRAVAREQMAPLETPPISDAVPGMRLTLTGPINCDFHSVEALRRHFAHFGTVDHVEIPATSSSGQGFVIFSTKHAAQEALAYKKRSPPICRWPQLLMFIAKRLMLIVISACSIAPVFGT